MEPPGSLSLRIRRRHFPTKALCISRYSCSFAGKRFVYPSPIVTVYGEKATSYLENWSQFGSLQDRGRSWPLALPRSDDGIGICQWNESHLYEFCESSHSIYWHHEWRESLRAVVLYSLRHCNQPKCRCFQYDIDNIFSRCLINSGGVYRRSQYSSSMIPITGCPSDK